MKVVLLVVIIVLFYYGYYIVFKDNCKKESDRNAVLRKHCSQVCKDFGSTMRRCEIGVVECNDGKLHNFLSSWYEP